jgi:hypothetical protein
MKILLHQQQQFNTLLMRLVLIVSQVDAAGTVLLHVKWFL